ncbi:hypothetical protein SAMN05216480_1172 [Pustulibacterium marinum]|uniref:Uncharacterized protein n=1 Tax=Pustulibacterium marinum TaxID=1224947 RepID=A0A1I7IJ89_9FLAO|nr:hypothetical protein [Pustulibacterium marinum]SFU73007.1 hypothetical protein SAMN05216480_1172 [Pustulibacterium marinum]
MKTKWYLGTVLAILAIWGIVHNRTSLPNQEILVSFHNNQISEEDSKEAIGFIERELAFLDASNIQIQKGEGNQLKISYYSSLDIVSIQSLLAKSTQLQLSTKVSEVGFSTRTHSKKQNIFELAVYEIQKSSSQNTDSSQKATIISKQDYDRSTNSHLTLFFSDFVNSFSSIYKDSSRHLFFEIQSVSIQRLYEIPEVRAGPSPSIFA